MSSAEQAQKDSGGVTRDSAALAAAASTLAGSAAHQLSLFCGALAPAVYGTAEFTAAVRGLAVRSPRAQVRVLLRQSDRVLIGRDHPIVDLSRRLPSRILLWQAESVAEAIDEDWLITDQRGFLRRPDAGRPDAQWRIDDSARARQLLARFDRYWAQSLEAVALRQLSI